MDRPHHCCSSVTIDRTYGPITPLLRVCSNRPHGQQRRYWGPSAQLGVTHSLCPNQMDKRTNTGPSQNIIHTNIASRDKNLVYLCVGYPRSLKMVPLDRTRNFLFFVQAEVYAYLELFPRYGMSKKFCGWNA